MGFLCFGDFASDGVFAEVDSVGEVEVLGLVAGSSEGFEPSVVDVCDGECWAGFYCEDSHLAENLNVHFDTQIFDAADTEGAGVIP